ncbi:MAG TPA: redoxin domain-containing protein [Tepidisphaeraceae bacterium]|jgi:thiol-disulfide isomerase/thioredoxin|nr:redoxin domain-containing protein [Tepidisphaeraceae bacterium]
MLMISRPLQILGIWVLLACAGAGGKGAPALEMRDITGVVRRPLELGDSKAAVIVFISTDCPVANGYAPEINRICKEYESKHVSFYMVHTDPALKDEDARKHAKDFGFTCPVLIDREHELVKRLGATITPEAAVVGGDGVILYRGRIDDLYVALGKKRFEATTHDLRVALDAVVAGRKVPTPRTAAIGCAIDVK